MTDGAIRGCMNEIAGNAGLVPDTDTPDDEEDSHAETSQADRADNMELVPDKTSDDEESRSGNDWTTIALCLYGVGMNLFSLCMGLIYDFGYSFIALSSLAEELQQFEDITGDAPGSVPSYMYALAVVLLPAVRFSLMLPIAVDIFRLSHRVVPALVIAVDENGMLARAAALRTQAVFRCSGDPLGFNFASRRRNVMPYFRLVATSEELDTLQTDWLTDSSCECRCCSANGCCSCCHADPEEVVRKSKDFEQSGWRFSRFLTGRLIDLWSPYGLLKSLPYDYFFFFKLRFWNALFAIFLYFVKSAEGRQDWSDKMALLQLVFAIYYFYSLTYLSLIRAPYPLARCGVLDVAIDKRKDIWRHWCIIMAQNFTLTEVPDIWQWLQDANNTWKHTQVTPASIDEREVVDAGCCCTSSRWTGAQSA